MEIAGFSQNDLCFKRDFRLLISGPSGSGKTSACLQFLRHRDRMFSGNRFEHYYWCVSDPSSVPSDLLQVLPSVKIVRGLSFVKSIPPNSLCVFDDIISKIYDSEDVLDLAVRRSSHEKISFIILSQNLYFQSKYSRTINLSMSYLVLFNYLRDASTYETLCRQIGCRDYRALHTALTSHLNSHPYNYFIIDAHPTTPSALRYRTVAFLSKQEAEEHHCGDPVVHTLFLTDSSIDHLIERAGEGEIAGELVTPSRTDE